MKLKKLLTAIEKIDPEILKDLKVEIEVINKEIIFIFDNVTSIICQPEFGQLYATDKLAIKLSSREGIRWRVGWKFDINDTCYPVCLKDARPIVIKSIEDGDLLLFLTLIKNIWTVDEQ